MPSAITELVKWAVSIIGPAAGDPRTAASVRTPLGQLADRSKWLKMLADRVWGAELAIIGRAGNQLEITNHGLPSNTPVRVFATSGGSLPTPLAENTVYYVRVISANYIELSATSGPGPAITLTADGSGDHWISTVPDWISALVVSDASYGSGAFKNLVMWLAGAQTVSGAKTFNGQVTIGGTNKINLVTRAATRMLGHSVVIGVVGSRLPQSVVAGDQVLIPLVASNGSSLTTIRVNIWPDTHVGLPATMPSVALSKVDLVGTQTIVAAVTDPSPDVSTFNANHNIVLTLATPEVVQNDTYNYVVVFDQEDGAGSLTGQVKGASYDTLLAVYDDAAS